MLYIAAVAIIGLVAGSFLEAFTYRVPQGIKISQGRSKCPKCSRVIAWYDNIPLISFCLLQGKCRRCGKSIPLRCPLIEASTAIFFASTYFFHPQIIINFPWLNSLPPVLTISYLLLITALLLAVMITDIEHQIVLDQVTFFGLLVTFTLLLFFVPSLIYSHLLAGFSAALFLLLLHLITKARGMGLGDVKLALFLGTFLGVTLSITWMFISFVIGALIGIILLIIKKKRFRDKIAFGPFLVISFYLILFLGPYLTNQIIPM